MKMQQHRSTVRTMNKEQFCKISSFQVEFMLYYMFSINIESLRTLALTVGVRAYSGGFFYLGLSLTYNVKAK